MAYYEKDKRKIATLIDFDLATFPGDTQAQSEAVTEPTPSEDNAQAVPTIIHPRPEDRSGTTPFMAIETLDVSLPGYKHHLCHELESIFYVVVWHAVGYRHKKRIYPTKFNRNNTDRKKIDILKGWRTGSWDSVKKEKVNFYDDPSVVFSMIILKKLARVVLKISKLFSDRQHAFSRRRYEEFELTIDSEDEEESDSESDSETETDEPAEPTRPRIDLFPQFARAWRIKGMKCGKSCCVA